MPNKAAGFLAHVAGTIALTATDFVLSFCADASQRQAKVLPLIGPLMTHIAAAF